MMIMNNNNPLKLNFSQDSSKDIINIKPTSSQSSSGPSFKSVLDTTVNNSNRRTDNTAKNDVNQDSDNKTKFKSFAEVQMNRKSGQNKPIVQTDETQTAEVSTEKSEMQPDKYDQQIVALAQMLGITPGQLADLAKQLGFSLEDLKDVKKLAAFMGKVSDLLQLNDKQKEILIKLATEVSNQTKTEGTTDDVAETAENSAVGAENNNSSSANKVTFDLSKVAVSVKEKLDAMINSGKDTPQMISDEVAKIISAMKAQAQPKVTVNAQQTDVNEVKAISGDNKEDGSIKENKANGESKSKEAAKETTSQSTDSGKAPFDLKNVSTSAQPTPTVDQNTQQDQQNLQALGDIKSVLNNSQIPVEKSAFATRQPVSTSDIVNQVVEQAKVTLGQDKSEMVIQLKPDHLGKLELKVVTEQGIVAAKFIAENQKVKEIIETNMQLLKDSLQKQGISVEGVSVQVGQDSKSDNRNQNLFQGKNNLSSNGVKYGTGSTASTVTGTSLLENLPERLAQYTDDLNTINLTA